MYAIVEAQKLSPQTSDSVRVALSATGSRPEVFEFSHARANDKALRPAVMKQASCMHTPRTPGGYRSEAAAAGAVRLMAQARSHGTVA